MMEAKLEICFESGSLESTDFYELFNHIVKFNPSRVTVKYNTKPWNDARFRKVFLDKAKDTRFFVEDDDGNYFSLSTTGSSVPFKSVTINQKTELFLPSNTLVEGLIKRNGFVSSFLLNNEYEEVQSTVFSNNLKGKDYQKEIIDTIKNTPSRDEMWGGKEYDTKFNPGSSILISYTWLMVGWKMWFGEGFFHIVSKEKILSFPHAIEVKELSNGIVYVQLFEKLEEPYTPDAIFRQWKWREWMGYDELKAVYT